MTNFMQFINELYAPKKKRKPPLKIRRDTPRKPREPKRENLYISILELKEDTCRYPMTDKPVEYCGKKLFRKSCCEQHYYICYQPETRVKLDKLLS